LPAFDKTRWPLPNFGSDCGETRQRLGDATRPQGRHTDTDGGLDAHWDAVAANIRLGDIVNVVGTSACIIGLHEENILVPGVCGVVPGSVVPGLTGIEAGLSAVGDMFEGIARRGGNGCLRLNQEHGSLSGRTDRTAAHGVGTTGIGPSW